MCIVDTMYLPERCTTSSLTGFNKGVIISQRGERYAPDIRCTLHLRVRSSARAIRFTFEHMDLPEIRPGHCEDYVEFYTPSPDTDALDYIVGGPFCGQALPDDFFSNGTSVLVRFTSNSIRQRSGFRFRFERISYSVDLCTGSGSSRDCSDSAEYPTAVGRWRFALSFACSVPKSFFSLKLSLQSFVHSVLYWYDMTELYPGYTCKRCKRGFTVVVCCRLVVVTLLLLPTAPHRRPLRRVPASRHHLASLLCPTDVITSTVFPRPVSPQMTSSLRHSGDSPVQ